MRYLVLWILLTVPVFGAPVTKKSPDSPLVIQGSESRSESGLVAYDCNSNSPKVTTISATEIAPCIFTTVRHVTSNTISAQIVQRRNIQYVHTYSCQILESRFIHYCGSNSHLSGLDSHEIMRPYKLTASECKESIQSRRLRWRYNTEVELSALNATYATSHAIVGWYGSDGSCSGGTVHYKNRILSNAVVYGEYKIMIRESWSPVEVDSRRINIFGELTCNYKSGSCYDDITGTHVWDDIEDSCIKADYDILYEGPVEEAKTNDVTAYTIEHESYLLYSEKGYGLKICGSRAFALDYPNLYIVPLEDNHFVFPRQDRKPAVQLMTYLNAKIVFSHQKTFSDIRMVFDTIQLKTCEIERQLLRHRLELIRSVGKEVGLQGLGFPGAYAKPAGEVIHIIQCEAVGVTLRSTDLCYSGLPVTYEGKPMFLTPGSRVLTASSPTEPCSPITSAMYQINNEWIEVSPRLRPVTPPYRLTPNNLTDVPFKVIKTFAKGGIYSHDDVISLQQSMSFPALRDAVVSNIATGLTGEGRSVTRYDVSNIMTDAAFENIAYAQAKKVWGWLGEFGMRASGFVAIIFLFQLILGVLQAMVNFQVIRKALGCSAWMLCCCFNSMTQLAVSYSNNGLSSASDPLIDEIPLRSRDPLFDSPLSRAERDARDLGPMEYAEHNETVYRLAQQYQRELDDSRSPEHVPRSLWDRVCQTIISRPAPASAPMVGHNI